MYMHGISIYIVFNVYLLCIPILDEGHAGDHEGVAGRHQKNRHLPAPQRAVRRPMIIYIYIILRYYHTYTRLSILYKCIMNAAYIYMFIIHIHVYNIMRPIIIYYIYIYITVSLRLYIYTVMYIHI